VPQVRLLLLLSPGRPSSSSSQARAASRPRYHVSASERMLRRMCFVPRSEESTLWRSICWTRPCSTSTSSWLAKGALGGFTEGLLARRSQGPEGSTGTGRRGFFGPRGFRKACPEYATNESRMRICLRLGWQSWSALCIGREVHGASKTPSGLFCGCFPLIAPCSCLRVRGISWAINAATEDYIVNLPDG